MVKENALQNNMSSLSLSLNDNDKNHNEWMDYE